MWKWNKLCPYPILIYNLFTLAAAWDQDQLELFDLIEEVDQNFYELLGVAENAESAEIRKAYRKLSLQLHPDRNPAEDAETKFRQMVAVYETLKSEEKRRLYDGVLKDGLPDWRQPVYYYRKARKLGLLELAILLFIIFTVGHYLVIWAVYLEKKFEMEELLFSQMKRKKEKEMKKKRERNAVNDQMVAEGVSEMVTGLLEAPTIYRLLPIQMSLALRETIFRAPEYYHDLIEWWHEWLESRRLAREEVDDGDDDEEEVVEKKVRPKRKRVVLPEYASKDTSSVGGAVTKSNGTAHNVPDKQPVRAGQPWTTEELSKLSKALTRFPNGTLNRCEKIAEFMERNVAEITKKMKEMRESQFKRFDQVPTDAPESQLKKNKKSSEASSALPSDVTLRDTGLDNVSASSSATKIESGYMSIAEWSQNQQKIFEWCLAQYPKGTSERWDKIAEHIPGKTKSDCIQRFKFIVETLKQKKNSWSFP